MSRLPPITLERIAHVVAVFKATESGSPDTTVGNTLAQLNELSKTGRAYDQSIARLADDRCGVDYTTHAILQPLAKAVLANKPGAREEIARAVGRRIEELREHKRVNPDSESLRYFCGLVRLIFAADAVPN
jgi:hypothetical protein